MSKLTLGIIGGLLSAIIGFIAWQQLTPPDPFLARQVKSIAPAEDNYLIDFYPHISEHQRPEETYPFPIPLGGVGPTTNLYSGPNQYPFFCMSVDSKVGQPEVDNQEGLGVPVTSESGELLGFSKDCGVKSHLQYFAINADKQPEKLALEQAKNYQGTLFRAEQGTINRFIYTIVMPIKPEEVGDRLAKSQWNNRLVYQFNGGSGIGFRQGRQKTHKVMQRQVDQLLDGYAIISSSGNKTSYTYNMLLAEDTARRVKKQFTSLYGEPLYTVGVGGSGGGLAQYLIAQNSTGILDGLLPLYSYPDMISQTTYALDCDLLNNYFTFRADDRKAWRDWDRRRLIEGMNAINDFPQRAGFLQPLNQLMAGFVPSFPDGNSECINGYFGLSAYINNPKQGFLRPLFADSVVEQNNWSYWQDMKHVLGTDQQGFGRSTWDNVGVQYGLNALLDNKISIEEFFDINYNIGAWKSQPTMQVEHIITPLGPHKPLWLSLWGSENIYEANHAPAQRHTASLEAIEAAYRSGQVFIGKVDLPIIDARHYLENELDMHHMSASFYSRLRIDKANGDHKNHIIWVAHKDHDPTQAAFAMIDKWLLNLKQNPNLSVIEAKPQELGDTCFEADGSTYAKGEDVFNGKWNQKPDGACQSRFPMFSTSRIESGGPWAGDIFKCHLIDVETAIEKGMYGSHPIIKLAEQLKTVFPHGVCDYEQGDMGRPSNI